MTIYETDANMRCQDGHLMGWLPEREQPGTTIGEQVLVRDITDEFQLQITVVEVGESSFCGYAHWDTLIYRDEEGW